MSQSSDETRRTNTIGSATPALHLPALGFSQGMVLLIRSPSVMRECTRLGFKRGFYKDLAIVDSERKRFQVVGAHKIRTLARNLREILELLSGNPHWQVELVFSPDSSTVALEKVKELIFDSFQREKDFWDEKTGFEDFRDRIKAANSMEQIIQTFENY
jgi:hypothetical protein